MRGRLIGMVAPAEREAEFFLSREHREFADILEIA
jgi:hypothetical protein